MLDDAHEFHSFYQAVVCAALRESWCFHLMIQPACWPTAAYFFFDLFLVFLFSFLIIVVAVAFAFQLSASFAFPYWWCWNGFNAIMSVEATKQRGYEPGEQHNRTMKKNRTTEVAVRGVKAGPVLMMDGPSRRT